MHLRSVLFAIATLGVATVSTGPQLVAQGFNCVLLGRHHQYANYNDIWGYVAPNGKEYALLGATTGLVVIDCSNPATPVQRGYFPWATSTWRDIRTYGHYAYVSSEGGGGFMIVDLSNPDAPVNLGIFGTSYFGNAHNICVDVGAGKLYLAGCNTGTPVFDLAANPANPPFLGYLTGSGNSNYFHDLCVENGYAFGSMIYNGVLRITDVTTPLPGAILSNTATPSTFTHNAWPNAGHTLIVTTDERAGGVVKFFDITNKSAPIARGQFTPNPVSIPHNAFIVGDLCHVSWYTEGYQCIDVSDPNNPRQVAAYDTWPGASGGYNGAWGVYPFQPSGNIYVSDITTGLYVVRPQITDLAIAHTPLASTTNEDGPYAVVATVTGSNPLGGVSLAYRVGGGSFTTVAMAPTANPNEYAASIPGQDAIASVEYHIDAQDSVAARRSPQAGEHAFIVGTFTTVWSDDFETDRGWTHGMTATQDDWQRGAPLGRSGTSGGVAWSDPSSAPSGTNVWGNDLGGTGFNGSYGNGVGNWLQSPLIPTGGVGGLKLRFQRWLTLAAGDTASVLVNGVVVWTSSAAIRDTAWQEITLDIAAIAQGQSSVTLRFELSTNATNIAGGWNLDDVLLFSASDAAPPLFYGNATPGTGGLAPVIGLSASARIGTTTDITGSSILANANAFVFLNLLPDATSLLGFELLVSPLAAITVAQVASGSGNASWSLSIPNDPALDDIYLYSQWIVLDGGAPGGLFSASRGMRFRIHQD
ncbi:MAG: choice-of-anchor B family protein [Planctomycetes bacterium]|nr:choice-of-anchor B family protein [Planctomycetota bacterium]